MSYMELIKRKCSVIVIVCICILIVLLSNYISRLQYVNAYCEISLKKITDFSISDLDATTPHWITITEIESLDKFKEKYDVSIESVDFTRDMLIVSYGAEINYMDYNTRENSFKNRGKYIGFPEFGDLEPNKVVVYKANTLPLFSAEIAGFPPEYSGKYR